MIFLFEFSALSRPPARTILYGPLREHHLVPLYRKKRKVPNFRKKNINHLMSCCQFQCVSGFDDIIPVVNDH